MNTSGRLIVESKLLFSPQPIYAQRHLAFLHYFPFSSYSTRRQYLLIFLISGYTQTHTHPVIVKAKCSGSEGTAYTMLNQTLVGVFLEKICQCELILPHNISEWVGRGVFLHKQFVLDILLLYVVSFYSSFVFQYEYNFSMEHSISPYLPPRHTQSQYWESLAWSEECSRGTGYKTKEPSWMVSHSQQQSTYWNDFFNVQIRAHIHNSPQYQSRLDSNIS